MAKLNLSVAGSTGIPVHLLSGKADPAVLGETVAKFADAAGFNGKAGSLLLCPSQSGGIAAALYGIGSEALPMDAGRLARLLPEGDWELAGEIGDPMLAALGFTLGGYRFDRYRNPTGGRARLVLPPQVDRGELENIASAVHLARDLINTPTNDLGPAELEAAIRQMAGEFSATVESVVGDDLLARNFPMVHAVGRASTGAPRLVDMVWGDPGHPKVTLVGKGVCFDSGGLNIKPGDSMALMKKDMGGAANTMALARMIMQARLPVRLRLIVPAVENAISGNAFRPGDILPSRKGLNVEIGNTDAEGRLILSDALALADEEAPQLLIDMATLTGAARVALGPDLPALFCDDSGLADEIMAAGQRVQDPTWRLPLWPGYRKMLSSDIADLSHVSKGGFAGSITAALFLQRFVSRAVSWAHFDVFAWAPAERPWAPVGGEAQAVRALYHVIGTRYRLR